MSKWSKTGICFSAGQIFICLYASIDHVIAGPLAAAYVAFHAATIYSYWQMNLRRQSPEQ
jgi:hypothetical protein